MNVRQICNFLGKKGENRLTKRMISTFLVVVIIPLLLFIFAIQLIVTKSFFKNLKSMAESNASENAAEIYNNLDSVELIKKMITSNGELMIMLMSPDIENPNDLIEDIMNQSTTLERVISIEKNIYGVRIFANNKAIMERFPIILHADRLKEQKASGWKYNYKIDYLNDAIMRSENLAVYTSEITYGKRSLGYLSVEVEMKKMFPFLYEKTYGAGYKNNQDLIHNYVYFIDKENASPQEKSAKSQKSTEKNVNLTPLVNPELYQLSSIPNAKFTQNFLKKYNSAKSTENFSATISDGKNHFVTSAIEISELGILLVNAVDVRVNKSAQLTLFFASAGGILILVLILLIVIIYITTNLLKGVYSIIDGMKQVRSGNLEIQIKEIGNDEITETQHSFNQMVVQLRNQMNQIKTEQELITETEMKAMLNQINAHFLYNVLETIRMQALINEDKETSESILVLGKMMRYCLRWRIVKVSVAQELEYINSYIYILNIRNDYKIDLEVNISKKIMEQEIPKMIIQPLVENSFFYAIEPLAKDSLIKIYSEEDKNQNLVWLCVQDFGCGMTYEKIAEIQDYLSDETPEKGSSNGSIGLKNIQMRLCILYGKDYRLQIISKEGSGTLIRVPIPLEKTNQ